MRCIQYFSRSSLSLDEAAVALNLAGRPFRELFTPLDLAHVAPWGFLAIEKGLFGLLGRNELGLRLLPFVSSLVALVLLERLCRRILKGLAVPFAVGCLALGTGLIDYAAQLKQYSTDVTAAIAILLLAVLIEERGLTTLSHVLPLSEGRLIFDCLDRIARPLERTDFRSHGSFSPVVLAAYDLSDPDKLSATTSEAFPVPDAPTGGLAGLPCQGTMGTFPASLP